MMLYSQYGGYQCIVKNRELWRNYWKSYKSNKILTAGRAIFPFKGYFMGLIKDFDKLCSEFPDIYLEIVSDGPDIDKIKSFIDSLDESVKREYYWQVGYLMTN